MPRYPILSRGTQAFWLALVLVAGFGRGAAAEPTGEQLEFFEKKVRPVLSDRCYQCHSSRSEKLKGGLLLDSREGILKGGDDGPVITPGAPERSKLVEAIEYQNPDLQMPPKSRLPADQIAVLVEWIKMGAPWPAGRVERGAESVERPPSLATARQASGSPPGFDLEKRRREHWAWQPIRAQTTPRVKDERWPCTTPDRFILAKLEENQIRPAPPAERRVLIRRLYFDLIGLPPTPGEVEAFAQDGSAGAYERVVDRLLASPRFGERWARHWLDLVRYAETLGHEFDYTLHNAWRYRDYVIRAFNADVPYDQLVTEHIAGDLLAEPRRHPTEHFNESVIGTGFFWLGQRDHSPVDVRQHQAELIDNQIDVMSKTFLGLTVACARCHDHKFDAIAAKDFYALYGVLESSRYAQKAIDAPEPLEGTLETLKGLKQEIRRESFREWSRQVKELAAAGRPGAEGQAAAEGEARAEEPSGTQYEIFARAGTNGFAGWFPDGAAFAKGVGGAGDFIIGDTNRPLRILHEAAFDDSVLSRRLEGVLRSPSFEIRRGYLHVLAGGRESRIRVCVDNFTMIRDPIYGGLMKPLNSTELKWMTFDLKMWKGQRAFIELCDLATPDPSEEAKREGATQRGYVSASQVVFSDDSTPPAGASRPSGQTGQGSDEPNVADLQRALELWGSGRSPCSAQDRALLGVLDAAVQKGLLASGGGKLGSLLEEYRRIESAITEPAHAPGMADGDGFDEHVFIRGNHKTPGEVAPRQFLTALAGKGGGRFKAGSGRLELAHCLTDASDPLLSRVMVNRVWLHLFGRGIVPTPDDFGALGQPPSHPELLDWLAGWYRTEAGWSTKKLIRLLATSSAYRMSSKSAEITAEEKDPGNALLHRMPIRRLEGEAIRDAMLAISGRLDDRMFGPSVPTHLTEFMEGRGRPGASGPIDGAGRRSIYLEVRRNFLSPMMRTFDSPVPFSTIGRRTASNVPAQSLILLNDPFVLGQAQLLAQRILSVKDASAEQRIQELYQKAFGRPPNDTELAKAMAFLQRQGASYGLAQTEARTDEKVWTDLCHVILNLKEFVFVE